MRHPISEQILYVQLETLQTTVKRVTIKKNAQRTASRTITI
jgi:hypothetical protein